MFSAKGGEPRAEGVYSTSTFARGEPDAGRGRKDNLETAPSEISRLTCRFSVKTAQQKTLGKKERESNLDNCFTVTEPTKLNGKHILIIDDVTTTGATLTEMYKTINNCEGCLCAAIDFAVFART